MTRRFWMLLACLLLVCTVALAECAVCGGDSVCDTCGGQGYQLMKAYGSEEQVQVACTAGCDNGRCPTCAVLCDVCGSDQKCDVCGGLGYQLMKAYGSDEMVQVACMGENCADGACAVCSGAEAEGEVAEVIDLSQEHIFKDMLIKEIVAEELGEINRYNHYDRYSRITYGDLLKVTKVSLFKEWSDEPQRGPVSTLEDLRYMPNLENISLNGREISDLSPLSELHSLKYLSLSNNNISDLSPLENLHSLESLGLHNNDVSDLSPIAGLTNLRFLYLDNNEVTDVSPLANLVQLEKLLLQNNNIVDLSALAGLTKLQKIDVEGNDVTDISVLANMKELTEINVRSNHIKDLSVLDNFPDATRYSSGNEDAYVTPTPVPTPTPEPTNTPKPTFRTGLTMVSDGKGGFKFVNITPTPMPTPPTIDLMAILAESEAESKAQSGNTLTIEVFIGDDHRKYTITTKETYVLDALLEANLIEGEDVSWGFNVTVVDGVKANYNRKGEYWSILEYVNGSYQSLMDSLGARVVEDGDRYAFRLMN